MRLVSFDAGAGPRAGLLEEGLVVEVGDSVLQLIEAGLDSMPAARGEPRPLAEVALLPPIGNPQKIIGIGLNYRSHAEEAGREAPEVPTFFGKFANALAAPGAQVALPESSAKVDYEAEVAFVVGRRAKAVSERTALDHVAGYMLFNDLSARDLQFQTPQWMPGKVFDGSAPCGPALVTAEEGIDPAAIDLALTLNGEQMQGASTADLIHSIPALVAHLSRLMTLEPGDIVSTGTPAGVGSVRKPRVWLAPGDEIVVSSPQLGELVTRIV
ncbi:MAG: fumarylacetoacetate hydrolase family protein [Thermoleophilaceae bacterium]|nr:fumarylacetoacetate hydrolase family protein [Thermoleophilaceae bacterium]